jgi:hypothetical protein
MPQIDWNAEAAAMARHVNEEMMSAHRGAMPWLQVGISVVFGNDGYSCSEDQRAKDEVDRVRRTLEDLGVKILGFAVSPGEGYSWAMLVETDHLEMLSDLVWRSWDRGVLDGYASYQRSIALAAIEKSGIKPDHSAN